MTRIRVLIADDMDLQRELLGKLLERQPDIAVVGEAGSPEEAVSATAELSPDVVLMDLRMPRHDPQGGIRAIRQIKDRHPQVKVLALTESDDEADVRAAALAGAIGYIVKSVKAAKIAEAVRAAVEELEKDVASEDHRGPEDDAKEDHGCHTESEKHLEVREPVLRPPHDGYGAFSMRNEIVMGRSPLAGCCS